MENVKIGEIYQHYKGKNYKVIAIARYSEDPEQIFVVYQALYDSPTFGENSTWIRPIKMFSEKIIINENEILRFKRIFV